MTDMRTFFQPYRYPGEHMKGTVLLHITAVFDDDPPPVSAECGPGSDIYVLPDKDLPGNGGLRVHKRRRMDHRAVSPELVYHKFFCVYFQVSPSDRRRPSGSSPIPL